MRIEKKHLLNKKESVKKLTEKEREEKQTH